MQKSFNDGLLAGDDMRCSGGSWKTVRQPEPLPVVAERVMEYAIELAVAARIFTLEQISRHPDLVWRSQPVKRASSMLGRYPDVFERTVGVFGEPHRFRLSRAEKRRRRLRYADVDGRSRLSEHWLTIGDLYATLTLANGRPLRWIAEPKNCDDFDVLLVESWRRTAWLIEIQRTPMRQEQWEKRWTKHLEWYESGKWAEIPALQTSSGKAVRPRMMLLQLPKQREDTVSAPLGVRVVYQMEKVIDVFNSGQSP